MNAHVVLLIVAITCWFFAAIWGFVRSTSPSPLNLEALGLFFYGLSLLVR
jgi:hypothetical protein